jgi:hypothetical protein
VEEERGADQLVAVHVISMPHLLSHRVSIYGLILKGKHKAALLPEFERVGSFCAKLVEHEDWKLLSGQWTRQRIWVT